GISGGIAFGYFTFHYKGYEPQLALLTRNTFDPFQRMLERLGVQQEVYQTDKAEKGLANLQRVLEEGQPAIVWADAYSLPYEAQQGTQDYWAMWPIVVYGHDGQQAYIADRAQVPLKVDADALAAARGRVKKDKYRVMSLGAPREEKLASSTSSAIWQCIQLFTEAPPRGSKNNFGLSGLQHWAKMLTNTRNKQGWQRFFAPGSAMFAALAGSGPFPGLIDWILAWGDGGAERARYADFLEEAALLLEKPALNEAAGIFRESHTAWQRLAKAALPPEFPLLAEARQRITERERLFIEQGGAALEDIQAINQRLAEMLAESKTALSEDADAITELRANMQQAVLEIHAIEARAIESLKAAMS
ncbi:MAG: BtrH N-terminal domain-containing protein, partial [Thiotrichales bacterium]|nr:BtrH N-terminal domain-containing protein [Thiotrichales bacterium]